VMVGPHDADRDEAQHVAQVGGPEPAQREEQRAPVLGRVRDGTRISSTSSVIATANTPSLNASMRVV